MVTKEFVASIIDHTLLKPESTPDEIKKICREAMDNKFASVCINPCYVSLASKELMNSNVNVCTVIGFPLGANTTDTKVFEAQKAVKDGANEVDMVINVGMLKAKENEYVKNDIKSVRDSVPENVKLKVIIETCLLTDDEKVTVCKLAKEAGADFVKTSTGFSKWGAKAEDVKIMRKTVGDKMGVKASGGIHTFEDAVSMIESGATRLGTSASLKIIK